MGKAQRSTQLPEQREFTTSKPCSVIHRLQEKNSHGHNHPNKFQKKGPRVILVGREVVGGWFVGGLPMATACRGPTKQKSTWLN